MKLRIYYESSVQGRYALEMEIGDEMGQKITDIVSESDRKVSNYERKERYHHNVSGDKTGYGNIASKRQNPEEELLKKELLENVFHAMKELPEVQRRRLCLAALDEMTLAQIAEIENVSTAAVGESIKRARETIRQLLKDN